jgi:TPR repeat protein
MNFRHFMVLFVLFSVLWAGVHFQPATAQTQNIASLQKQAKEGNADAQYELAKAYLSGTGVPKDSKQGVDWLRKAANLGNPAAELALAIMYRDGREQNIPKDPKQGLVWLWKSAGQNYAPAEYNLATLYRRGDKETGVLRKPHDAATWFRKAARQQGLNSQTSLQEMLQEGLISKQEANWKAPEPLPKPAEQVIAARTENPKPFSLLEVEKGLQGGITCKRLATLVDKFKVDFSLSVDLRQRLGKDGADDNLLATISASKGPS